MIRKKAYTNLTIDGMRILIVEDDAVLADGLVSSMGQAGYVADWVADGEEADCILAQQIYDLVILDLGLPRMNGLHVLERMRKRKNRMPVLILTALDALEDRIKGLDLGADDYITKPFDLPEVEAHIRALLRRSHYGSSNQISLGPLCFDTADRRVTVEGQPLELSGREICLLELLLRRAERVVSKEQMLENLYGWDEEVSDNAVEVYIHRLRKKLDNSGIIIRTIRGLGYILNHSDNG